MLAVALCLSFHVFAACGDDPTNLLRFSNCGFDVNTSGWTLVRGDLFVHHPSEGYWEPGAGYVEPTYYPPITRYEFELDGPCVPVINFTEYRIGAYVKGLGPMSCAVSLFEYSDTSCNNWLTGSGAPIFNSSGDWVLVDNRNTTSPTTQGARLHFYCQNPSSFLGLLDDAFMVPGDVIFADSFDSGSTAAWDSTT